MRLLTPSFFYLAAAGLVLTACYTDPDFSDVPQIEYENVELIQTVTTDPTTGNAELEEQLSITIFYQDGDGDLGLYGQEGLPPYNQYFFFSNAGEGVPVISEDQLVETSDDGVRPGPCEFLTGFVVPNDNNPSTNIPIVLSDSSVAQNLEFEASQNSSAKSYYVRFNPRYTNFNLNLEYAPNNPNNFVRYGFECIPYNGRFPFDPEFMGEPVSGTITYSFDLFGALDLFPDTPFRFKLSIYDRAGNVSNTIESPVFTLSQVLRTVNRTESN